MNADYGITPEQYHHGIKKLWEALGKADAGPQEVDVFTQSADMIKSLRAVICDGICNFATPCGCCEACERVKKLLQAFDD